jgi:hypothetical protein
MDYKRRRKAAGMSKGGDRPDSGSDVGARSGPNVVSVEGKQGEAEGAAVARTALRPTVNAAMTTATLVGRAFGTVELVDLVNELSEQCRLTTAGNLGRPEAMLTAQAHTLDAIFNHLARRAARNMGEYMDAADRYMRLALKAQGQCRATLEALANIKNPPSLAFVGQANIAHGPQQVNNEPTRTREIESEQSKLLEQTNGERLDTRAAGQAIDADTHLEAVGAFHRPEDTRG